MTFLYIIFCVLLMDVCCSNIKYASVTYIKEAGRFLIQDSIVENAVAHGSFEDEIFSTGWSYLEVKTDERYPDQFQAYAAGVVEGYLTATVLKNHYFNMISDYCKGEKSYCKRLSSFLQNNLEFIDSNVKLKRKSDGYWHQVALTLEQLHGVEDGYRNITSWPSTDVDVMGFLLLNLMGDLIDLEVVLGRKVLRKKIGGGSCSALVKILPNNKDIYFSHNSWTTYESMLRILKKYSLKYHTALKEGSPVVTGHTYTFSSYPGMLFSGDDFYLISSGLAVMETTIDNRNASLWQYVSPQTVLEWQRNIIANRLARDGQQWMDIFAIMNSGTYNNQWMVLDYNKFQPGKPLQEGLFHVLEQLPGYCHGAEKTGVLREQGYWASYNVPYYEDIFNMSGNQANVEKYGDFFTHDYCPRALIFKRDQGKVDKVDKMIKLMRYNDFKNDPLSRCNCTPPYSADCAISARDDLNPPDGIYPFDALGHNPIGAIDLKLTTFELYQKLEFIAISGPTYDNQPPFQWSKSDFNKTVKHEGHPDLWQFKPIIHKWM